MLILFQLYNNLEKARLYLEEYTTLNLGQVLLQDGNQV